MSDPPKVKKPRGVGRRFQKGVCPNPGGISKERREFLRTVRTLEEPYTKDAIEVLRNLALKGVEWALKDYLDRMGMKLPDKLELTGEDGAPFAVPDAPPNPLDPSSMTSEQVRKRLEAIRAERAALLAAGKNEPGDPT